MLFFIHSNISVKISHHNSYANFSRVLEMSSWFLKDLLQRCSSRKTMTEVRRFFQIFIYSDLTSYFFLLVLQKFLRKLYQQFSRKLPQILFPGIFQRIYQERLLWKLAEDSPVLPGFFTDLKKSLLFFKKIFRSSLFFLPACFYFVSAEICVWNFSSGMMR